MTDHIPELRRDRADRRPAHALRPKEHAPVSEILVSLWVASLLLSLLGAQAIRAIVVENSWLGSQRWALTVAGALTTTSQALGMAQLYEAIEALATRPEPETAFLRGEEKVAAPLIPEPRPPSPVGDFQGSSGTSQGRPAHVAPLPRKSPNTESLFSEERVRRVLIVGASSIQFYLGSELERLLGSAYEDVKVMRFGKLSTGLVRPDVLDWPHTMAKLMDEFHPQLVIGNFGGNDAQNMLGPDGAVLSYGTPEWDREYKARVRRVVDLARSKRAEMALLGMPIMRDPGFSRRMAHINRLTLDGVRESGGFYIPTWDLATDDGGTYRKDVSFDGVTGLMRLPDGTHYSRLGAKFVARQIGQELERLFLLFPRDPDLSVAVRREFASPTLGAKVPYIAYLPRSLATTRVDLPVIILWHSARGPFTECLERAHGELQELSMRHRLVLVVPALDDSSARAVRWSYGDFEKHLLAELTSDLSAHVSGSAKYGILGWSADRHQAIRLALHHQDLFASASSMGGAADPPCPRGDEIMAAAGPIDDDAIGRAPEASGPNHAEPARGPARAPRAHPLPVLVTTDASDPGAAGDASLEEDLSLGGVDLTLDEQQQGEGFSALVTELGNHLAWHAEMLANAGEK
jgi:hypothetical protein